MKQVSGKNFAKVFTQQGWTLNRVTGSHHLFTKAGHPMHIAVPVHGNQPLKIGLLRALMKTAAVEEKDL